MIELKNVSKSFDDKKVLDSFSAVFEDGMYLLKGPSGIGKTTCIRLILGLLEPDEGEIKKPDNMRFSVCFQEIQGRQWETTAPSTHPHPYFIYILCTLNAFSLLWE